MFRRERVARVRVETLQRGTERRLALGRETKRRTRTGKIRTGTAGGAGGCLPGGRRPVGGRRRPVRRRRPVFRDAQVFFPEKAREGAEREETVRERLRVPVVSLRGE